MDRELLGHLSGYVFEGRFFGVELYHSLVDICCGNISGTGTFDLCRQVRTELMASSSDMDITNM